MDEAGYGYWGFSPSNNPAGGYREYGVDLLGLDGAGLHHRPGAHHLGPALRGLPRGHARADDVRRRRGHPARVVPRAALRAAGGAGEPRATSSATSTPTGRAASTTPSRSGAARSRSATSSLDQGMVMAALGNALAGDDMRRYVVARRDGAVAAAADGAGGVRDRAPMTSTDAAPTHAPTGRTGSGSAAATPSAAPRRELEPPAGLAAVAGGVAR